MNDIRSAYEAEYGSDDEMLLFDDEYDVEGTSFSLNPMSITSDQEEEGPMDLSEAPEELSPEERLARDPLGKVDKKSSSEKSAQAVPGKGSRNRSEYFTFTIQLGKDAEKAGTLCDQFKKNLSDLKSRGLIGFHSCSHEVGGKEGRHHIQGYLETASNNIKWSYAVFRKHLGEKMGTDGSDKEFWVKKSEGSAVHNRTYTQKDADKGRWFVVDETIPFRNYGRGNQTGRAKELASAGKTWVEICDDPACGDVGFRYARALRDYIQEKQIPRNHITKIKWIHGPSGAGKSTLAKERWPASDKKNNYWLTVPKNGNVWWDKYQGQKVVVIDDMGQGTLGLGLAGFEYAIRLLDSTPMQVGVHGGMVEFCAELIVITANFPPQEWFPEQYCKQAWTLANPLCRRFNDYAEITLLGTEDENYERRTKPIAQIGSAAFKDGLAAIMGAGDAEYLLRDGVAPIEYPPSVRAKERGAFKKAERTKIFE